MRDKNKLKKMLALLSVGVVGLTPIATVVSCGGTTQKDNNNNDNGGNDDDNQNDVVEISIIKDDLQSLVNAEDKNDEAWDLTELQNEKLGGNSDNKDKTLIELGIVVTDADALTGTNTSTVTQHFTFTGDGTIYDGSVTIEHKYTDQSLDDISVIQDDLKALLDSKQDEIWTADDLLAEKLGGDSEYKDMTLTDLGISIEASDIQISDGHVIDSFKFTAADSDYIIDSNVSINQDIEISLTDSVYVDSSSSVVKIADTIPDDTKEILYLGIKSDSSSYVSIPDNAEKVTLGKNGDVTKFSSLFSDKQKLEYVDLSNVDTSNVTTMSSMFWKCYTLTTIVGLDKLDTSKVTDMGSMFGYCQNIESLDVSNFDTSNVTDMSKMFMTCQNLTSLDLSGFDTSKVTTIDYIFEDSYSLTTIQGIENWDMSSLTSYKYAFAVNYNSQGDTKFGDKDVLLECPNLSGWKVSEDFDQSDFISSTKFDGLKNYDESKLPKEAN